MKQLRIEHEVALTHPIKDLLVVNLDHQASTRFKTPQVSLEGIIYLSGKYRDENHQNFPFGAEVPFQYTFPFNEGTLPQDLAMNITDFDYSMNPSSIHFVIHIEVSGVEEAPPTFPPSSNDQTQTTENAEIIDFREPEKKQQSPKEEVYQNIQSNESIKEENVSKVIETNVIRQINLGDNEKKTEVIKSLPAKEKPLDLFNDRVQNQVVWSFRVILKGETIQSIAKELHLSEGELLKSNPSFHWQEGQLLPIPSAKLGL